MNGFSILMFIFGSCVFFAGLYMFTGWTMISGIIIFIIAILGWIFNFE